jgi:hypothetical protein
MMPPIGLGRSLDLLFQTISSTQFMKKARRRAGAVSDPTLRERPGGFLGGGSPERRLATSGGRRA